MSLKNTMSLSKGPARALSALPSTPRVSTQLVTKSPTNNGSNNPLISMAPRANNPSFRAGASSHPFTSAPRPQFTEYGEWDPSSPLQKRFNPTKATKSNSEAAISTTDSTSQRYYANPEGKIGVVFSRGGRWSTRGRPFYFNPRLAFDEEIIKAILASPTDYIRVAAVVQGGRYNVDKWPNAEDVEGLALEVKWVEQKKEVKVFRDEGGELVDWEVERVVEDDLVVERVEWPEEVKVEEQAEKEEEESGVELWEDAKSMAVS